MNQDSGLYDVLLLTCMSKRFLGNNITNKGGQDK